jgi:molecular chaperone GrpE
MTDIKKSNKPRTHTKTVISDTDPSNEKSTSSINIENLNSLKYSSQITELEKKLKESEDKSLRLMAEISNMHKHQESQSTQLKRSGKRQVLEPVVGFLTILNIAFAHKPDTQDEKFLKFFGTLSTSFEKVKQDLLSSGVELIIPTQGQDFDPITMQSLTPASETNKVVNTVSLGYKLDGQLIQPSMVML